MGNNFDLISQIEGLYHQIKCFTVISELNMQESDTVRACGISVVRLTC